MSTAQTNCPACGGPIRFKVGSALVQVCPYCRSAVARGDRKLEDLGKVAELTDTGAVLELSFRGKYEGVPFDLVGRSQFAHPAGGVWDEWYAAFADSRWGWLAEAQGHYYLTFEQKVDLASLPPWEEIAVAGALRLPPNRERYVIGEKATARALAAEGELPWLFEPGAAYRYADLSGEDGRFGTLDWSDAAPRLFLGKEVSLDQLGLPKTNRIREREARQIEGIQLNCPQCAGPLSLKAPDLTERVACPNCAALLDAKEGQLALFQALSVPRVPPTIPLGACGTFPEGTFTVIGYLQRAVTVEGIDYTWKEYLLYEHLLGFRWLVEENAHWNFVKPLPAGAVFPHSAMEVHFEKQSFRLFQRGTARVTYVAGEFYWKVTVEELAFTRDFIAPPLMLSREEVPETGDLSEVNWSLSTYLPRQNVEQAFGITGLDYPTTVAPNQPFQHSKIYLYWLYFLLAAIVLGAIFTSLFTRRTVHESVHTLLAEPGSQEMKVFFTEPFELKSRRNLAVTVTGVDLPNGGVYVEGELVHQESGDVQPFAAEVYYYYGVEDGEAWQEAEREQTIYLSAQPEGTYSLRLQVEREKPEHPVRVRVRVEQGVVRFLSWLLLAAVLTIPALLVAVWHLFFEHLRWQASNVGGTST